MVLRRNRNGGCLALGGDGEEEVGRGRGRGVGERGEERGLGGRGGSSDGLRRGKRGRRGEGGELERIDGSTRVLRRRGTRDGRKLRKQWFMLCCHFFLFYFNYLLFFN